MKSRSPAAVRAARRRQRERDGIEVHLVEVDRRTIETLIDLGWLSEAESLDRGKVETVLSRALRLWAQGIA